MGAQGQTTVNFGAAPGGIFASVAITGQTGILSGSLVEAWLQPIVTADHTVDEHILEEPNISIVAGNIIAGTGFTIYAQVRNPIWLEYGLFTVDWVWN